MMAACSTTHRTSWLGECCSPVQVCAWLTQSVCLSDSFSLRWLGWCTCRVLTLLYTRRCIEEAVLLKAERDRLLYWTAWAKKATTDALALNPGPGYEFWLKKSLMVSRAMEAKMLSVEFED